MTQPKRVMGRSFCAEARRDVARACRGAVRRQPRAGCEYAASDRDRRRRDRRRAARRRRSPAARARRSASQRCAEGFRRQAARSRPWSRLHQARRRAGCRCARRWCRNRSPPSGQTRRCCPAQSSGCAGADQRSARRHHGQIGSSARSASSSQISSTWVSVSLRASRRGPPVSRLACKIRTRRGGRRSALLIEERDDHCIARREIAGHRPKEFEQLVFGLRAKARRHDGYGQRCDVLVRGRTSGL